MGDRAAARDADPAEAAAQSAAGESDGADVAISVDRHEERPIDVSATMTAATVDEALRLKPLRAGDSAPPGGGRETAPLRRWRRIVQPVGPARESRHIVRESRPIVRRLAVARGSMPTLPAPTLIVHH